MVKHIVIYTLKEGPDKDASVAFIASLLEPLAGQITGLKTLEVRRTYQGGMDYCLYSEFDSREALAAYQQDPRHLAAKERFHHLLASRVCADYDA